MTSGAAAAAVISADDEDFAADLSLYRALPFGYAETALSRQRVITVTKVSRSGQTFRIGEGSPDCPSAIST